MCCHGSPVATWAHPPHPTSASSVFGRARADGADTCEEASACPSEEVVLVVLLLIDLKLGQLRRSDDDRQGVRRPQLHLIPEAVPLRAFRRLRDDFVEDGLDILPM